jgi:beta-galactosidase
MPAWAEAADPSLVYDAGVTHFCDYDIDHPIVRPIYTAVLNALVPPVLRTGVLLSVSLANEPGFQAANSTYTLRNFQAYLQTQYATVAELNTAWWSNFTGFDDGDLAQAMGYHVYSSEQQLVWGTFNRDRVTNFYRFLTDTIHTAAASVNQTTRVQIKINNAGTPFGKVHTHGIDRDALAQFLDVHGCDTRAEPVGMPHIPFPQHVQGEVMGYGWESLTVSTDLTALTVASRTALTAGTLTAWCRYLRHRLVFHHCQL